MLLNQRAAALCGELVREADALRVDVHSVDGGGRILDLGIMARGGLEAGRRLAEICLAGLGSVELVPCESNTATGMAVSVRTDHPLAACLASQYAGWQVSRGKYFAMGSGPMRAAAGKEPLFDAIGHRERADVAVGVLETRKPPPPEVVAYLAEQCGVAPDRLTLLVAPTASQAGTLQVVARSVETALHKLHELHFDLSRIESGWGMAPLPPVAADDLAGIGLTNDAVLYGAQVTLWVRGDDASLAAIGPSVPSSASADFGQPFAAIFARYQRNFYAIDPMLFSPAAVALVNLDTGCVHRFGQTRLDILGQSFAP